MIFAIFCTATSLVCGTALNSIAKEGSRFAIVCGVVTRVDVGLQLRNQYLYLKRDRA